MNSRFKICDAFGIPVYADMSSALLVLWLVFLMGDITAGVTCAILLAFSIVVHELAHSLTARAFGCRIAEIRLSLIGGCASGELPHSAWKEFLVAAAGPASSLAMGFGALAAIICAGRIDNVWLSNALLYFVRMNLMLGLFNLLPGFPMDGGRIFRSAMRLFMSREKATKCAMIVGRVAAVALVVLPEFGIHVIFKIIPLGGDLFFRLLIAFMIWREGYREYLLAKLEAEKWNGWRARVSPPPYGGSDEDCDVCKDR